jgi:branched-chain amino acid aminotransferase
MLCGKVCACTRAAFSGSSSTSTGSCTRPRPRVRLDSARERIIEEIRRTLAANDMSDGVHVRLTLTRGVKYTSGMDPRLNTQGPTLIVLAEHKTPVYSKAGLSLVTSSVRRFPPDCLDPKIHHNNLLQSILAKIEANVAAPTMH